MRITIVDPPSGWQFGFPAPLKEDYRQQLIDAGYPESQIDFAMKYSRYWGHDTTEDKSTLMGRESNNEEN